MHRLPTFCGLALIRLLESSINEMFSILYTDNDESVTAAPQAQTTKSSEPSSKSDQSVTAAPQAQTMKSSEPSSQAQTTEPSSTSD